MIYIIDKSLKKLPYISTAKLGTLRKHLVKEVSELSFLLNNSSNSIHFVVIIVLLK